MQGCREMQSNVKDCSPVVPKRLELLGFPQCLSVTND